MAPTTLYHSLMSICRGAGTCATCRICCNVCNCPDIPGVTSPMTYFGMWKVSPAPQLRAFVLRSNIHGTHASVQHLDTLLIPGCLADILLTQAVLCLHVLPAASCLLIS